ncbi:MAG: thioredoxin domain-containing protein, partial [Sulfurovaceae bacterium]
SAITKDAHFKEIAQQSINFMMQFMSHDHLFFSASDADSKEGEGRYFTYEYQECLEAFSKNGFSAKEAKETLQALDITEEGNFEGRSIVNLKKELDKNRLQKALQILRTLREQREYPFIDTKIITSWNAMMIESLFIATSIDAAYQESAKKSLDALLKKLYIEGKLYHTAMDKKRPYVEAFLEDYAYLCSALIKAYETTSQEDYLHLAIKLANQAIKEFYIEKQWHFSNTEFKTKDERYDTSYPSASALMVYVLLKLDLLSSYDYSSIIDFTLRFNSYDLMRQPISSPLLTQTAIANLLGLVTIKSTRENIEKNREAIKLLPFTIALANDDTRWTLCDRKSCFANENNFQKIIQQIDKKEI